MAVEELIGQDTAPTEAQRGQRERVGGAQETPQLSTFDVMNEGRQGQTTPSKGDNARLCRSPMVRQSNHIRVSGVGGDKGEWVAKEEAGSRCCRRSEIN